MYIDIDVYNKLTKTKLAIIINSILNNQTTLTFIKDYTEFRNIKFNQLLSKKLRGDF